MRAPEIMQSFASHSPLYDLYSLKAVSHSIHHIGICSSISLLAQTWNALFSLLDGSRDMFYGPAFSLQVSQVLFESFPNSFQDQRFFLALRVEINSHLLLWYRSLLCGSFVLRADLFRVVLSLSRICVTSAQFVNILIFWFVASRPVCLLLGSGN